MTIPDDKRLFRLWLLMMLLTLMVAPSPVGYSVPVFWYGMAWIVTMFKGGWIIMDFMELRHAPVFLRRILQGWLLITATAVALTAVWQ